MRNSPSRGRGPNTAFHERLRAHETDRSRWYPAPGHYLAAIRRADAITAAGGTMRTNWAGSDLDAAAWQREKSRALHARINAKGGITYSRYNDPHTTGLHTGFIRDRIALDNIRKRVRVYQFETRAVRERFSHLLSSYDD
jgi:hypothetical protein